LLHFSIFGTHISTNKKDFLKKIFSQTFFLFNDSEEKLKYVNSGSQALNKMEQCPLCCEAQSSTGALEVHIKKIHPQRNVAIQVVQ